jgi:hypothetical protein
MAKMDSRTKEDLVQYWLPRLRELEKRRRPTIWLMRAILLVPFLFALVLIFLQIAERKADFTKATLSSGFLGLAALSAVYLGKFQSCNDVLLMIEATVYLGDREQLLKAMAQLSCLGGMRSLLQDAKRYVR